MAEPAENRADATRVVRGGLGPETRGEPFLPGPTLASTYHLPGEPSPQGYGRMHNPTWAAYEAALGELEGGEAVLFSSGMAALSAVFTELLVPGSVLVAPADSYYATRALAEGTFGARGTEVRLVPTRTDEVVAACAGATLVLVETPSNPGLDVVDVRTCAAAAQAAGALLAVDNTLATALLQKPLALGADLCVTSATKALSGHSDLLLGVVAAAAPELAAAIRSRRTLGGATAGPFEAWLAHRSLATLDVRLQRQCANALAIATLLEGHEAVVGVRYPGLPGDPSHAVASAQMEGFGPVLGFDLGSAERADAFLAAAELIAEATSFGGVHTSAERRGRWDQGEPVPPGYIRLSAGIEAQADLLADVGAALARI